MKTTPASLPAEYIVRNASEADIPGIIEVMNAFDLLENGEADLFATREDILHDWAEMDPTKDIWVIIAPDGSYSGYCTVSARAETGRITADGYVHPAHYGRGIGSTIVELTEARAGEMIASLPEDIRVVIVNNVLANSEASCRLMEGHDYELLRVFFRMRITMNEAPPQPTWPAQIQLRLCNGSEEDFRRSYDAIQEAFKDHWGHAPRPYADWKQHMTEHEGFDPTLWFLAMDGDEIAGAALCRKREGEGWISQLGVRRPWRKQGLGAALLNQAFGEIYRRGFKRVGLGVDGQSLTGAQRLYESVGMEVTMRIATYAKELRAGRDLLEENNH